MQKNKSNIIKKTVQLKNFPKQSTCEQYFRELDFREIASLQTNFPDFQQHAVVLTPNNIALQDEALETHF